eukprot:467915-Rhodomonas_salina.1
MCTRAGAGTRSPTTGSRRCGQCLTSASMSPSTRPRSGPPLPEADVCPGAKPERALQNERFQNGGLGDEIA